MDQEDIPIRYYIQSSLAYEELAVCSPDGQ